MKRIITALLLVCLLSLPAFGIEELVRQKNVATRIVFSLVDVNGTATTGEASDANSDSEFDYFADGTDPQGTMVDLSDEIAEIGSTGVYFITLAQAEMNHDYIVFTCKADATVKRTILIRTTTHDPLAAIADILTDTAAQDDAAGMKTLVWGSTMADISAGAPAYNCTAFVALNYLYEAWRNKTITTATEIELYMDNASTKLTESDISDDGTSFTKGEWGAVD